MLEYGQVGEAGDPSGRTAAPDSAEARAVGKRSRSSRKLKKPSRPSSVPRRLALKTGSARQPGDLAGSAAARVASGAALRRAYESPGEPRSINLAEAYALNGQTTAAVEWYQRVMQQLDQDDPLREWLQKTRVSARPLIAM
jgi:hypothetical protein